MSTFLSCPRRLLPALLTLAAAAAQAQTAISHEIALAGSLPGDAAGYPVTISEPGHYRLTGNLVVPLNINAIVVTAPGVTLDLNGYTVRSSVVCVQNDQYRVDCNVNKVHDDIQGKSGVVVEGTAHGTVVRNGTVSGFRGHGLVLRGESTHVQGVRAMSNQYAGMWVGGPLMHTRVSDSTSLFNGSHGFEGIGAYLERVNASRNGGSGVYNSAGVVTDSSIQFNHAYGVEGATAAGIVGVRDSLVSFNKILNMGPSAASMGGNKAQSWQF